MRSRGPAWSSDEIETMLKILMQNNLTATSPTNTQLGQALEKPLRDVGINKMAIQIRFKLESLQTNYIICKKKGATIKAREHCPFYELLDEVFKNMDLGNIDLNAKPGNITHDKVEFLKYWTEDEVKKMLSIINIMNISKDLCHQNVPAQCLKLLSKGLNMAGFKKDTNQIQYVLFNLRNAYIKNRAARENGLPGEMCPYYDSLHSIWGNKVSVHAKDPVKSSEISSDKRINNFITKRTSPDKTEWKVAEIIALLDIIDELNLTSEFRQRFSTTRINKIVKPMKDRGYDKSAAQIITELKHLRSLYLKCLHEGRTPQAIQDCPHFERLERMFKRLHKVPTVSKPLLDHNYGESMPQSMLQPITVPSDQLSRLNHNNAGSKIPLDHSQYCENNDAIDNNSFVVKTELQNYITETVVERMEVEPYVKPTEEAQPKSLLNQISEACNNISPKKEPENLQVATVAPVNVQPSAGKKIHQAQYPPKILTLKPPPGKKIILTNHLSEPIERNRVQGLPSAILKLSAPVIPAKKPLNLPANKKNLLTINSKVPAKPLQATNTVPPPNEPTSVPPLRSSGASEVPESMHALLKELLRHQEQLQTEKLAWMERQSEIQRQHEREQHGILLKELRDFRRVFETAALKNKF